MYGEETVTFLKEKAAAQGLHRRHADDMQVDGHRTGEQQRRDAAAEAGD